MLAEYGLFGCKRRLFGEQPGRAEAAVHLVGRNLHEALDLEFAGGVEQHLRAEDVGADERPGVLDAAIDVALGREVDDRVDAVRQRRRPRPRGR